MLLKEADDRLLQGRVVIDDENAPRLATFVDHLPAMDTHRQRTSLPDSKTRRGRYIAKRAWDNPLKSEDTIRLIRMMNTSSRVGHLKSRQPAGR
jgi:hypothetical protein